MKRRSASLRRLVPRAHDDRKFVGVAAERLDAAEVRLLERAMTSHRRRRRPQKEPQFAPLERQMFEMKDRRAMRAARSASLYPVVSTAATHVTGHDAAVAATRSADRLRTQDPVVPASTGVARQSLATRIVAAEERGPWVLTRRNLTPEVNAHRGVGSRRHKERLRPERGEVAERERAGVGPREQ